MTDHRATWLAGLREHCQAAEASNRELWRSLSLPAAVWQSRRLVDHALCCQRARGTTRKLAPLYDLKVWAGPEIYAKAN